MNRAWLVPVGGVLVAPLVTWLPMLAARFPRLGLPIYPPSVGIDLWHLQAFYGAGLLVVAAFLWARDRWLAAACALVALTIVWRGAQMDPTHSVFFIFGALLLSAIRLTPPAYHPRVLWLLAGAGMFQAVYVIQQSLGYDVLWGPLVGGTLKAADMIEPIGTLGTVDAAAAYIAITAPLWPVVALPLAFLAVLISHSVGGAAALVVGLVIRYRHKPAAWAGLAMAVGVIAWRALHGKGLGSVAARAEVWRFGLTDWLHVDPVLGYGLGGWSLRIPDLQRRVGSPTRELWGEAHNEWIQWLAEVGVVGTIVLLGWLWSHRAMFRAPVLGGSLAALCVDACSFFPFHVVSLALLAITVVGLATAPESPDGAPA